MLPKNSRFGNETFREIAKNWTIAQRAGGEIEKVVAQTVLRIVAEIGQAVIDEEGKQ